jgi:hypothetical protein
MGSSPLVMEGTWEEIQARAAELAGHRVRVIVLPRPSEGDSETPPLDPRNQRMLELLARWEQTSLTEEELTVLDELERNLKEQPFTIRTNKTRLHRHTREGDTGEQELP